MADEYRETHGGLRGLNIRVVNAGDHNRLDFLHGSSPTPWGMPLPWGVPLHVHLHLPELDLTHDLGLCGRAIPLARVHGCGGVCARRRAALPISHSKVVPQASTAGHDDCDRGTSDHCA